MELAGEKDQLAVGLDPRTPLTSLEPTARAAAQATAQGTAPTPWPGFLERFAPAYEAELAAFVRAVRGEASNPCDGYEALEALRIAEACERSRREGRPVAMAEVPEATR